MSRRSNLDAIFSTKPSSARSPARLEASNGAKDGEQADSAESSKMGGTEAERKLMEVSNNSAAPRIRSGAIAAMGGALEQLARRAQDADRFETGGGVVSLDPSLLDGSFVADRVSDATDPSQDALAESMRESGQQVPILVRPHPDKPGRYQIAYGHRRARAAAANGVHVRAVIRPLSDDELVVAQGKENLDRRDLSYIERAFFALHLETRGFSRAVICAAMNADKSDVSRYVGLARSLPEHVVAAIGPAPKAGGPRWRLLAERLGRVDAERITELLSTPAMHEKPTDERFLSVLEAITSPAASNVTMAKTWSDAEGRKLARAERTSRSFNLSIDERLEPRFGDYLLDRLPEILADFKARKE